MLPTDFLEEVRKYEALSILGESLLTDPSVSVRLNRAKRHELDSSLVDGPVPWCSDGVYLHHRVPFTLDPALHQGCYYVQDASSMAVSETVRFLAGNKDVRYLDMCAAPGGKTIGALSVLSHGSLVVANEYDYRRASILLENVAKWGSPNAVICRGDTSALTRCGEVYDIVAVDAPCSGEGMMRKDEQAVNQWSKGLVQQCADLQRAILSNAWNALKPGGFLIFSTCTFNTVENEDNAAWMAESFGAEPVTITPIDGIPGIVGALKGDLPCYRFIPGRIRGEGLFLCVLRKPGNSPAMSNIHAGNCAPREKVKKGGKGAQESIDIQGWLSATVKTIVRENEVFAVPEAHAAFICELMKKADVISPGIHVATIKGKDLIPAHELALSTAFNPFSENKALPEITAVEVSQDTALRYLKREAIELPEGTAKGYVAVNYNGCPLGFVKNLGNRSNNLYPKNWAIRMQI